MNERGNTLINVLVTTLVFTVIGMSIIASTIGGAKRTELRESEISVTFDAMKAVDEFVTNLSIQLDQIDISLIQANAFSTQISEWIKNFIETASQEKSFMECMYVIDLSGETATYVGEEPPSACGEENLNARSTFHIDSDFTKVYELVLVTKNPNNHEGNVKKTIRKRLFLSPIPSFLKYAVGTNNELYLNGSPHIVGNIYSPKLTIQEDAYYYLTNGMKKEVSTPFPSVYGDIYTNSIDVFQSLTKDQFYQQQMPKIKHESRFVPIQFDETIKQQGEKMLEDVGITFSITDEITSSLQTAIEQQFGLEGLSWSSVADIFGLEEPTDQFFLINRDVAGPLKVPGDLYISSTIESVLTFDDLIVDGDVWVIGNGPINFSNIISTGNVHFINEGGKLNIFGNIVSSGQIHIESRNNLTIEGNLFASDEIAFRPLNGDIRVNGTLVTFGNLEIKGDANDPSQENDQMIVDSVMYVNGETQISNVNILGSNNQEKQLILLSKDKLTITRINEFTNFQNSQEPELYDGIPLDDQIKPLKAFFYTENKAELYGVGSLFYIHGGLFAKNVLEINAVRGEVDDITNVQTMTISQQNNRLSRFNVIYNKDVLLQRIDALPQVKHVSLFADEVFIE
ncbi:MAG: hypothetical protein H0Z31_08570 [Bacillus sp. (in: Bacteria)]|nr:hypothetical protein [Bacillus sp. (in: firmicutes)]